MLKRHLPVGLMALGGLLLLGSLAYWRYAGALANPGELAVPQVLADQPQSDQVSGIEAVDDISGPNGKQFPLVAGARAV